MLPDPVSIHGSISVIVATQHVSPNSVNEFTESNIEDVKVVPRNMHAVKSFYETYGSPLYEFHEKHALFSETRCLFPSVIMTGCISTDTDVVNNLCWTEHIT